MAIQSDDGGDVSRRPSNRSVDAIIEELFDLPAAVEACRMIGLEDLRSDGSNLPPPTTTFPHPTSSLVYGL